MWNNLNHSLGALKLYLSCRKEGFLSLFKGFQDYLMECNLQGEASSEGEMEF